MSPILCQPRSHTPARDVFPPLLASTVTSPRVSSIHYGDTNDLSSPDLCIHAHQSTAGIQRPELPRLPTRQSTHGDNNALSSPDLCISSKMSCPPTSSPLWYTCGMVGQSLKSLSTLRRLWLCTSSSVSTVS
jgi:hypothetical protein